jgi:hypothetical protein
MVSIFKYFSSLYTFHGILIYEVLYIKCQTKLDASWKVSLSDLLKVVSKYQIGILDSVAHSA